MFSCFLFCFYKLIFRTFKSDSALRALVNFSAGKPEKTRTISGPPILPDDINPINESDVRNKINV